MFKLWCKLYDKNNHPFKDVVIENNDVQVNRTKKVLNAVHDACYQFDLQEPIWLDANITDFKRHSKVRFNQDNFIEIIEFSYMEIQVIEEDWCLLYMVTSVIFYNIDHREINFLLYLL